MSNIYSELHISIERTNEVQFPDKCPICGAKIKGVPADGINGPTYDCGGQYRVKPQIQCHTQKWWGTCPQRYFSDLLKTSLLDAKSIIWAVRVDGSRFHIASFSNGSVAETFAKDFSSDYPRFWDDDIAIDHIAVIGDLGPNDGKRFRKGLLVAIKARPTHIKGAINERVWFDVKEVSSGSYQYGEILGV